MSIQILQNMQISVYMFAVTLLSVIIGLNSKSEMLTCVYETPTFHYLRILADN